MIWTVTSDFDFAYVDDDHDDDGDDDDHDDIQLDAYADQGHQNDERDTTNSMVEPLLMIIPTLDD